MTTGTFRFGLHVPVDNFDQRNGCLLIGNKPLTNLIHANQPGTYIYDKQAILNKIAHLRRYLPPDIDLHYAIKANPMEEVVQLIAGVVDGLDVASLGELRLALGTKIRPEDISFAGPGKLDTELKAAVESGIVLNVESQGELERISNISQALGTDANVALRVNPDFELKNSGMKMSGGPKAFGIDAEAIPVVLSSLPAKVRFVGLHIFCGSQNLREDAIIEAQNKTLDLAKDLLAYAPNAPEFVNIGGGFGIPYFQGDTPLQLDDISSNLHHLNSQFKQAFPQTKLVLELGRYLVAEAGIYVCRIVDRKISRGKTFLVTNGGLNHHLAASGNFGQVIRKNYPVTIGNKLDNANEEATIVGPLCTPLDILADNMRLPKAEVGDLVVVFQSGAYGFSSSPHGFLGHPAPLEVLV